MVTPDAVPAFLSRLVKSPRPRRPDPREFGGHGGRRAPVCRWYGRSMTRRITISLPDDVAAYAERAGSNTSGFIAEVLRRRMRADGLRARLAELGYAVSDEDVARTR